MEIRESNYLTLFLMWSSIKFNSSSNLILDDIKSNKIIKYAIIIALISRHIYYYKWQIILIRINQIIDEINREILFLIEANLGACK